MRRFEAKWLIFDSPKTKFSHWSDIKDAIAIELQLFSFRVIAEFEDETTDLTTVANG